jgi:hypothetical protein
VRQPVVSVVVNNYNYGRYLATAIESALAQTWPHTEVIVVDDGSTDDSRDVIRGFGDRIVVVLKENGGQGTAMNSGVASSTGDVVIHLDSDDRLHPEFAAIAVDVLSQHPEAAAAQFRLRVADSELRPSGTVVPPAHVRLPEGDISASVARWELPSALGPGGAMAFSRATVDTIFPMPTLGLRHGPDMYLVRAAALLGPVVSRNVIVADYRSHGGNDSNVAVLDPEYLHEALTRQVVVGRLLSEFATTHGLPVPTDPLHARDPIMLSQRLASLRVDPDDHVFADTRFGLVRAGVRAALRRPDVAILGRLGHATWFVVVALSNRALALKLASWLLFPLSRPRLLRGGLVPAIRGDRLH